MVSAIKQQLRKAADVCILENRSNFRDVFHSWNIVMLYIVLIYLLVTRLCIIRLDKSRIQNSSDSDIEMWTCIADASTLLCFRV